MNEHNIEGSFPEFRWVGDKDRYVWIYKQHNEDTEKDGRGKEPFINLVEVWVIARMPRKARLTYPDDGPRSHDEVCEYQRVTYSFDDHFLWCKR